MTTPQLLAISSGAFEIIAGALIAMNFGARFFAILLMLYVAGVTYYVPGFWNLTWKEPPLELAETLLNLLKNMGLFEPH